MKKQCNTCLFWTGNSTPKSRSRWACTATVPWWVDHTPNTYQNMTMGTWGTSCESWKPKLVRHKTKQWNTRTEVTSALQRR